MIGLGLGLFLPTLPADTTAPTLVLAVLAVSGLTLTLTYDEALDPASNSGASAYTLGGVGGIQVDSVDVTGSTVVLTLEAEVLQVSTVTVSAAAGHVRDLAGNNAAALTSQAVTNNSTYFDRIYSIANGVFSFDSLKSEIVVTEAGVSDPADISLGAWTKTQLTAIGATTLTVDAGATAPSVRQNINNCGAGNPCVPVLYVFRVKTTGFDWIRVNTRAGTVTAANCIWFNTTSGTVGTNGANLTNATIGAAAGDGSRLVYVLCEINGGTPMIEVLPCTADNSTTAPAAGSVLEVKEDATYSGWVYQRRIAAWYDRVSGEPQILDPAITSGRADVQPGYGTHPLVDKCGINGTAALRSVGGQRLISTTAAAAIAAMTGTGLDWTVVVVMQPDADDPATTDAALVSWGQGSTTSNALSFGFNNGGGGRHGAVFVDGAATTTRNTASADMTNDRAPKKMIWRSTAGVISLRENGVAITLASTTGPTGAFAPDRIGIFATAASGSPNKANGRLGVYEMYSRSLSVAECQSIEADILAERGF